MRPLNVVVAYEYKDHDTNSAINFTGWIQLSLLSKPNDTKWSVSIPDMSAMINGTRVPNRCQNRCPLTSPRFLTWPKSEVPIRTISRGNVPSIFIIFELLQSHKSLLYKVKRTKYQIRARRQPQEQSTLRYSEITESSRHPWAFILRYIACLPRRPCKRLVMICRILGR